MISLYDEIVFLSQTLQFHKKMQIDIIQTKDSKLYKIEREIFSRYSAFFKTMVQDSNEDIFTLYNIHSEQFDYLFQFMQLHKKKEPLPLSTVEPGIALKTVMEEADAELITRIFQKSPQNVKSIINAAYFLHMSDFLKRLSAGTIANLAKSQTRLIVQQSKKCEKLDEAVVSQEIHRKIKMIFQNREKERLQGQE